MKEYEKTENRIIELQKYIAEQKTLLDKTPEDSEEAEKLLIDITDAEVWLGECEAQLDEMAGIDGYESYEAMCDECYIELNDEELYYYSDGGATYYDYFAHV